MKTIIAKSETFRRSLKFTSLKTGSNINLSGCTAYAQMRTAPGGTLLGTATTSVDVDRAVIIALWDAEMTASWNIGECGFDIWLKSSDGDQKPIYSEQCQIVKSYTENMGD